MDDWLKRENRRLEKENERLRSLLFSTKKDKTIQVSSYYNDKLKEAEKLIDQMHNKKKELWAEIDENHEEIKRLKEKLKKIESACETWKMLRGMGVAYKGFARDNETYSIMEKAADGILNIIKEKHEENSSEENSSEEKSKESRRSS